MTMISVLLFRGRAKEIRINRRIVSSVTHDVLRITGSWFVQP